MLLFAARIFQVEHWNFEIALISVYLGDHSIKTRKYGIVLFLPLLLVTYSILILKSILFIF